jgi:hypothetical protein
MDKLTQKKLITLLHEQNKRLERLEETIISLWRAEDMEENNGKFRYPFDEHGNLLPNTNITRRIDK